MKRRVRRPHSAVVVGSNVKHKKATININKYLTSHQIKNKRPNTAKVINNNNNNSNNNNIVNNYMRPTISSARKFGKEEKYGLNKSNKYGWVSLFDDDDDDDDKDNDKDMINDMNNKNRNNKYDYEYEKYLKKKSVMYELRKNKTLVLSLFKRIDRSCKQLYGEEKYAFERFRTNDDGSITWKQCRDNLKRVLGLKVSTDEVALIMSVLEGQTHNNNNNNNNNNSDTINVYEFKEAVELSNKPGYFNAFINGDSNVFESRLQKPNRIFSIRNETQKQISVQALKFLEEHTKSRKAAPIIKERRNDHLRSDSQILAPSKKSNLFQEAEKSRFKRDQNYDDPITARQSRKYTNRLKNIRQQQNRIHNYAARTEEKQMKILGKSIRSKRHQLKQYKNLIYGDNHDVGWLILHDNKPFTYKYRIHSRDNNTIPNW